MCSTSTSKPGLGDPYWYEWSVGQKYLLEMLNPDNKIEYVSLQKNVTLGLDDVVLMHKDGSLTCIQVKHTRANNLLSFSNLITPKKNSTSLLKDIAKAWNIEKDKYNKVIPMIYTNREPSKKESTSSSKKTSQYLMPPLTAFLEQLNQQLKNCNNFEDIIINDYEEAWNVFKKELVDIKTNQLKLNFLKLLEIRTNEPSLNEIESELIMNLMKIFSINRNQANSLLANMDHALRKWTTSERKNENISKEDVYDALSVQDSEISFNQDFIPAKPFFKSRLELISKLEKELLVGKVPVIFLRGLPGIGKTNIISKLTNKHKSLINIRYYAYEPIQPDKEYLPTDVSKRVQKEVFWNELLTQLRYCLKGELSKYNFPLKNSFLTDEQKRNIFLKISSQYAQDQTMVFVIAIDGIDHAARAGINVETFLNTLPNPEYIPQNIKFLISGQPENSYPNYPNWLLSKNKRVKKFDITGIERQDIYSLVDKELPQSRQFEFEAITDIINEVAQGNTLATIFAVHEAKNCVDISTFNSSIKKRELSSNIEVYYGNIWESTISKLRKQYSFMDYKLAGILAFLNEPIDSQILCSICKELKIPKCEWENILKSLQPLVIKKENKYRILHNDIRIFLSNILESDCEHVIEISGALANYYIENKNNKRYYFDIYTLLKTAKRSNEMTTLLNPQFAIEAYVNGMELIELSDMTNELLKELTSEKKIDFEKIQMLTCTFLTLNQINNTQLNIEDCMFRDKKNNINFSRYECYVEKQSLWNIQIIYEVLEEIFNLLEFGLKKRANKMFERWFSSLTLKDIWNVIKKHDSDDLFSMNEKTIANGLGIIIGKLKVFSMFQYNKKIDDKLEIKFFNKCYNSYFSEIISIYSGEELEECLLYKFPLYVTTIIDILILLLKDQRFSDILIIDTYMDGISSEKQVSKLLNSFIKIITIKTYKNDKFELLKKLDVSYLGFEYEIFCFCILAFVMGYLERGKDSLVIAGNILELYSTKHSNRNTKYYGILFNILSLIGQWKRYIDYNTEVTVNPQKIVSLVDSLFIKKRSPNEEDFNCRKIYPIILNYIIILSTKDTRIKNTSINNIYKECFTNNPVNQLMEAGWFFYNDNKERLAQWYNYWLGKNGLAWNEAPSERNNIAKSLIVIAKKYHIEEFINLEDTISKLKWSVIGFSQHKEYILDNIFPWYQQLIGFNKKYIDSYSAIFKKLSYKIGELGDNRLGYEINCSIYGDLFSNGFDSIKDLLNNEQILDEIIKNPENIVYGFIGYLQYIECSQKELAMIWSFSNGILNLKNDFYLSVFTDLKGAISITAKKQGFPIDTIINTPEKMEKFIYTDPKKYSTPESYTIEDLYTPNFKQAIKKIELSIKKEEIANDIVIELETIKGVSTKEKFNNYLVQLMDIINQKGLEHYYYDCFEYIIKNIEIKQSIKAIKKELEMIINNGKFNVLTLDNLALICKSQINIYGESFCKKGLDNYIEMLTIWITSNRIIVPSISQKTTSAKITTFFNTGILSTKDFCVKYLIFNIMGIDIDRIHIALKGLYLMVKADENIFTQIFQLWDLLNYQAQEWILMIVELCIEKKICSKIDFKSKLLELINSPYLNVALYSNLLLNKLVGSYQPFTIKKQAYFDTIPKKGNSKFLFFENTSITFNETSYIRETINKLYYMNIIKTPHLEERIFEYSKTIEPIESTIFDNKTRFTQLLNRFSNKKIALLNVIYAELFDTNLNFNETELAQVLLSSSEPEILLEMAYIFPWNNGVGLNNSVTNFCKQNKIIKQQEITNLLSKGLKNNQVLLGGVIVDYDDSNELFCYMTTYFSEYLDQSRDVLNKYSLNGRLLLINNDDYSKSMSNNLIVLNRGVTNFFDSKIRCTISTKILKYLKCSISMNNGISIINEQGKQIISFEKYNLKNEQLSNRLFCTQPQLQRWIINKDEYIKIQSMLPSGITIKNKVSINLTKIK